MYLEACGKLKLMRESGTEDAAFNVQKMKGVQNHLQSSIQAIEELEKICINMLGIPKSTIEDTQPSGDLASSSHFNRVSIQSLADNAKLLGYYISICFSVEATLKFAQQILCYLVTLHTGGASFNHIG